MRSRFIALLTALAACVSAVPDAWASETGPVVVIPGRPGVPYYVFGQDINWAVIEGDWGLDRPSNTNPTIIYRVGPPTEAQPLVGAYFPKAGRAPRLGRDEHDTPRKAQPSQSFNRGWGVESQPTPVTIPPPYPTPPIVVAPEIGRRHRP